MTGILTRDTKFAQIWLPAVRGLHVEATHIEERERYSRVDGQAIPEREPMPSCSPE